MNKQKKVELFNTTFDNLTMKEAIKQIEIIIERNKINDNYSYVVTPNIDHIVNVNTNKEFKEVYDNADLVLVDGMPIVKLSNIFGTPLKEKVSGSDLTPELFRLAQKEQYRVFIFGSKEGVAETAIDKIKRECSYNFPISCYSPPFGFEKNSRKLDECISYIENFKPDILLVSLGSPKGELFIFNNLNTIKVPISFQIGASIDFVAGTIKRAPFWMQNGGLEWFYRFLQEPKRMFKRYFIKDSLFIKIIFQEIIRKIGGNSK
ncbi:teichoic acid biosynthesis protein [Mycobacteroides abscessus subsp. abscessus]|nr:teichoic acid biosynthesis protein [Mycobacteroides abscessus subsp. abscessus]